MAGPGDVGSVIEHGGLMAYYQPHPVVTTLNPPIHLEPVDWMKTLGVAAQEAGKQIATSPLNPMVRAQMQAETQRANLEQSQLEFAKNNDWTRNLMSWGPNGLQMVSPISAGQGAWLGTWPFGKAPNAPEAPNGPGYTSDYVAAKKEQEARDAAAEAAAKKTAENPDLSTVNVNPTTTSGNNDFGAQNTSGDVSSGDVSQWIQKEYGLTPNPYNRGGLVQGFADGGPVKAPPAPGNDQLPQAPPVQQAPAPDQPMPASTPVYNPFSSMVTQPGDPLTSQAQLQQWQASNQSGLHPVIPSAAVKDYLQKNWDTRVKDVTYNPAGGPGGSPTYTAHQKDGGSTTIPLGQLVKNAPHLVMGNNMSFAMSAAEANPGQPAPAPGQAAGAPQAQPQPTPPPQPQPTPGVQPPPAPNLQQDLQDARIQQQVAAQTQNPQNLTAGTDQNGNVPQGPNATSNIEFSNPSNVPDSWRNGDALHTAGIPPGADQLLAQIRPQNDAHDKANDWDKQPDGPYGLNLKVAGVTTGLSGEKVIWYRDMSPGSSNIPFYILGRNAHNTERVYADGAWTHSHVDDPDINLDTEVQNRTGQDSRNWNHDQKVWAILNDYNLKNKPMLGQDVQDKLQALLTQAQSAQDISDAIKELGGPSANYKNWEEPIGGYLEWMREHARDLDGVPLAGQLWHAVMQSASGVAGVPGDTPNASVVKLLKGYTTMMGDPGSAALTPTEAAQRNTVQLSRTLPTDVANYFAATKDRLKNYITTAVYQGQKVPQIWMKALGTMANTGRVPAQIIDDKTFNSMYNTPPASLKGTTKPISPGPSPGPGVRTPPEAPSQSPSPSPTPIDVRHGDWKAALRGKPIGTQFIDAKGLHTLKQIIQ